MCGDANSITQAQFQIARLYGKEVAMSTDPNGTLAPFLIVRISGISRTKPRIF
jgi:hypothetical protein